MRKRILVLIAIIALGFFGTAAYVLAPSNDTRETREQSVLTVSVTIDDVLLSQTVTVPAGTTALELLTSVAVEYGFPVRTKEYAGMGTLVEGIADQTGGMDGKYWMYYINDSLAAIGADSYVLQPDDRIEWKFEVPQQI